MKNKIQKLCVAVLLCATTHVFAQNTFPSSGNVGVGISTPGYPLDVRGNGFAVANFMNKSTSGDRTTLVDVQNGTGTLWRYGVGGTGNGLGITAGQFYFERYGLGSVMAFSTGGNVGINNNSPLYKLHLNSPDVRAFQIDGSNTTWTGMYINTTNATAKPFYGYLSNNGAKSAWHELTPAGDWQLYVGGYRMTVAANGAIGIGTTTPNAAYKLSVNGTIRAKEVIVETGWADFVFDKEYKLKTLSEVESFIKTNKHLPDVPSAKEVEANGVTIGKMNSILLQKVEELTLYLIEVKKQNEALQQQINSIAKQ